MKPHKNVVTYIGKKMADFSRPFSEFESLISKRLLHRLANSFCSFTQKHI